MRDDDEAEEWNGFGEEEQDVGVVVERKETVEEEENLRANGKRTVKDAGEDGRKTDGSSSVIELEPEDATPPKKKKRKKARDAIDDLFSGLF